MERRSLDRKDKKFKRPGQEANFVKISDEDFLFRQSFYYRAFQTHFFFSREPPSQYESRRRRLRLKCDGARAETRFRLSAKRTSPFKSAGASGQSTTGNRGVRISGSNAGYTMFRGSVKGTGYPLHSPVCPSLSPPVRHRVPSHFNWNLTTIYCKY